jgi:toxin-antitoxin system PIN domain toxin
VFVVDTNVLVYAANEDSPHFEVCGKRLEDWRRRADAWFVTWSILYEFLRVTSPPRILRKPWAASRAWEFISALLDSPGLSVLVPTERHATVAEQVIDEIPHLAGNILHDAHTAILMREHGIRRIYTRDAEFHRFPFLEPIDPLGRTLHDSGRGPAPKHSRRKRAR